jgi:hypothetical protein
LEVQQSKFKVRHKKTKKRNEKGERGKSRGTEVRNGRTFLLFHGHPGIKNG